MTSTVAARRPTPNVPTPTPTPAKTPATATTSTTNPRIAADDDGFEETTTNAGATRPDLRRLPQPSSPQTDVEAIYEDDDVVKVTTSEPADSLSRVSDAQLKQAAALLRAGKDPLAASKDLAGAYQAFLATAFGDDAKAFAADPQAKAAFVQYATAWRAKLGKTADVPDDAAKQLGGEVAMAIVRERFALLQQGKAPKEQGGIAWAIETLKNPAVRITPDDELMLQRYRFAAAQPQPAPTTQTQATQATQAKTTTSVQVVEQPQATTAAQIVQSGRRVPGVVYNVAEILKLPDEQRGELLFRRAASRSGFTAAATDVALKELRAQGVDLFTNAPEFTTHTTSAMLEERIAAQAKQGVAREDVSSPYYLSPGALALLNAGRLAAREGFDDLQTWEKEKGSTLGAQFTELAIDGLEASRALRERLGVDSPVGRAVDEYGAELAKVGGNLLNLGQILFYEKPIAFVTGWGSKLPPEREALIDSSIARIENATTAFEQSIPKETSTLGSIVRGGTGALLRVPQYAAYAIAPPLATFYNAGKYANRPFEEFAGGLAQDWLTLATGRLIEVPGGLLAKNLGDVVKRQVGAETLKKTTTWLAVEALERTTSGVIGGASNLATSAPVVVQQAMNEKVKLPDGTERAPTKEEVKQRLVQSFAREFGTGLGMAVLTGPQRDADMKLFNDDGAVVPKDAKVYGTMRDGAPEYVTVVQKGGKSEMVVIDPDSPKGRELLLDARAQNRIVAATKEQVDTALITSRLQNRVSKQNVEVLKQQAAQYADARLNQRAALQQAQKTGTTDGGQVRPIGDLLTDIGRRDLDPAELKHVEQFAVARRETMDAWKKLDLSPLDPQTRAVVEKAQGIVEKKLLPDSVAGAVKDNKPALKRDSTADHANKILEAQNGLKNAVGTIQRRLDDLGRKGRLDGPEARALQTLERDLTRLSAMAETRPPDVRTQTTSTTTGGKQVDAYDALYAQALAGTGGTRAFALNKGQVEAAFGKGPYAPDLAPMLQRADYALLAVKDPPTAKRIYEALAWTDAATQVGKEIDAAKRAGTSIDFAGLADRLDARRPTVTKDGNFEVRQFPKGATDMPAIDVVVDGALDHNGAFRQGIRVGDDGKLVSSMPTRGMPFAGQILGADGKPLTDLSTTAILRTHGGTRGLTGASNQEAARIMADAIEKSGRKIDQVVLVACSQADRRSFSLTSNGREFEKALQQELGKRGLKLEIVAAKEPGLTSNYGNAPGQFTADGKTPLLMQSPAKSPLPAGLTPTEKQAALAAAIGGGAGAAGGALVVGYVVYRITRDDEDQQSPR